MPSDPVPDTADGAEGTEASDEEFADASPGLAGLERTMHSVAVFSECSYEFVEAIMLHVRKILLHAGKVLVSEDTDAPKSMYAVLWGTLDVYRMGQKIGSLSNGQVLGEGLLVGIFDRWTTTVVARNSCMVCEVPQTALSEALLDHPEESEYFKSLADYFGLRAEEWAQHGCSEMRLALRRPASLRQVSEDFLAALEAGLVSHLYFAGDVIHTEGQEDPPLAFLFDGDVSVEAAGRAVRREEVPSMEMRFVMEGETTTGRGSTAITDSETGPGSPTAKSRRSSASGRRLSQARRPSVDTGEFNSSLMAVSNRARAEAMMAEATAGGPEPGFIAQSLPEAAVFGEEAFLGLIPCASVTVRVCKMSEVRLLYRSVFDQILEKFPADREWLQRFQLDAKQAFPFHDFRDHPICQHVDLSNEFFDFLSRHVEQRMFFPGDHILPDNLSQFVPSSILSPTLNISCAAVNVGHVRLQTLHDQPLLPFGHLSSGDILGPGSILPGSWFWSGAEVQALQLCCLTVLHRGIIARALEEYPREREKVVPLLVLEHQQQSNPRSTVTQVKSYRQERVAKILRERSIFSNTSQEFLAEILNFGTVRVFMPGDRIIQQGAEGNSMFILSVGMAEVVKESLEEYAGILLRNLHFIGGLTYGSVFGELVMLGVQAHLQTAQSRRSSI
ncbi:Hcn1 [Symbiodinium sp. CCMP2592]|nr:Hcn1 [Symbiodinium sp. CCMP2592]